MARLLGRRRMVIPNVHLPQDFVERVLWLTGARTIQEVAEMAVNNLILQHTSAEQGWRPLREASGCGPACAALPRLGAPELVWRP
jgi:hypothetical protein